MKLFLGYESALEFWRAAGCGLAPIPEPSSIRSIAVFDSLSVAGLSTEIFRV